MITFKLLGGEILLYPELVNSIIGYINFKATLTNIRYRIIITTNGTQLSNIKVKKILDRWKYVINYGNISFDGSPICHDINRVFKDGTGSAAHILNNVKISKQYLLSSNMGFIYTISKNTIRYIKNSIQYFVSNMFNLKMSFEFDFLINSEKELKETVDEFNGLQKIENNNSLLIRDFTGKYINIVNNEDSELGTDNYCGLKLFINAYGDISPCISFIDSTKQDISLCNIKDITDDNNMFDLRLNEITNMIDALQEIKGGCDYCPMYFLMALGNKNYDNKLLSTSIYFKEALNKITEKLLYLYS
jgi:sulfatase maturation enzyme AslB (radical SAM superfamily)